MNSLPEGLVTASCEPSTKLTGLIDVGDITRLWRVYHAVPRLHPSTIGHRLENLFWRICGSDVLLAQLDTEKLDGLIQGIAEDKNKDLKSGMMESTASTHWQAQARENKSATITATATGTGPGPAPEPGNTRLPSILKKHKSQKNRPLAETKSTRLLLPGPEGQNLTHSPSTPPTPLPARSGAATAKQSQSQAQSQSRKKAATQFVARNRNFKRRPVGTGTATGRRKTRSSPTTSTGRSPTPQRTPSPLAAEVWVDLPDMPEELTEEILQTNHTPDMDKDNPKPNPALAPFIASLRAQMKAHPVTAQHGADMAFHLDAYTNPHPTPQPRRIDIGTYRPWNRPHQSSPVSLVEPGFRQRFSSSLAASGPGTTNTTTRIGGSDSGSMTEVEADCPERERQTGIPDARDPGPNQTQTQPEQPFDDDDASTIADENVPVESATSQIPIPPSRSNVMTPASRPTPGSINGASSFETVSTPQSLSQDGQTDGQGQQEQRHTPGQIRMDVSFEELEELSPMVW